MAGTGFQRKRSMESAGEPDTATRQPGLLLGHTEREQPDCAPTGSHSGRDTDHFNGDGTKRCHQHRQLRPQRQLHPRRRPGRRRRADATDTNQSGSSSPTSATVNIGDTTGPHQRDGHGDRIGAEPVRRTLGRRRRRRGGRRGQRLGRFFVATLMGISSVSLGNNVCISSGTDSSTNPGGINLALRAPSIPTTQSRSRPAVPSRAPAPIRLLTPH